MFGKPDQTLTDEVRLDRRTPVRVPPALHQHVVAKMAKSLGHRLAGQFLGNVGSGEGSHGRLRQSPESTLPTPPQDEPLLDPSDHHRESVLGQLLGEPVVSPASKPVKREPDEKVRVGGESLLAAQVCQCTVQFARRGVEAGKPGSGDRFRVAHPWLYSAADGAERLRFGSRLHPTPS